jgi:MFS family permease
MNPGPNVRQFPARAHRGVALAVLCLAAFTINLDTTIVNIALPSLMRQLEASTRELQWVVDAYTLTFAALVLAAGSLGDRYVARAPCSSGWRWSGAPPPSVGSSTALPPWSRCER